MWCNVRIQLNSFACCCSVVPAPIFKKNILSSFLASFSKIKLPALAGLDQWWKRVPSFSLAIEVTCGSLILALRLPVSDGLQGFFCVPRLDGVVAAVWVGLFVSDDSKGEHFPRRWREDTCQDRYLCIRYGGEAWQGVIPSLPEGMLC